MSCVVVLTIAIAKSNGPIWCGGCGGVFFDAGELDTYVRHHRPTSKGLEKLFGWMPGWTVGSGPSGR